MTDVPRLPGPVTMQAVFRIRGYDSFEQIAVGGMAVVYKARKQSIKKTVAIKVLLPHLAADTRFITRFQQEAEAAARIQHDNIVNVIDYGRSESSYYIVMEYYDGLTIEELVRTQPRPPIDVALMIVLNVCYGLEAAHAENLVHRDIKPANIIFTRQGGIKVADFGLAKAVDKFTLVTHTGKVVGTPAYMSPEQTRGEPVGIQTDIFSLGVVAYELLAARRPFEGGSYSEVVDRIQTFTPPALSSFNPLVEAPFERMVMRMLAKAREERYATATEVIADIEGAMDQHELRRDRRALADFFNDPRGYTETANQALLERLSGEGATSGNRERGRAAAVRHYRKVLYLDPADEGARGALEKLGIRDPGDTRDLRGDASKRPVATPRASKSSGTGAAPMDTTAEYAVVLEAIDRSVETPETFALKLSMRLKSPYPRIKSLVARVPCTVAKRLPYRKAKWLASIIEELGGSARLDQLAPEEHTEAPGEAVKPAASVTRAQMEKRTSSGGVICPRCGWEEEADAKFCSLCLRRFNKTDKIDVRRFADNPGFANPIDNPLAHEPEIRPSRSATWRRIQELPPRVLLIGSAAILLLPLFLFLFLR